MDSIVLDELGYLPLAQSCGQLLDLKAATTTKQPERRLDLAKNVFRRMSQFGCGLSNEDNRINRSILNGNADLDPDQWISIQARA